MLEIGIVGLPNAGKSTLFNSLLKRQIAQVAEYPFTTIEPNTGVVEAPDPRLKKLGELIKPLKVVPAAVKFIDIAGLVKNAHKGEGLGNQFLGHIRDVSAILHLVRDFENEKVSHVLNSSDPLRDVQIVEDELKMADIKKPTLCVLNVSEKDLSSSTIKIGNIEFIPICAKLEMELSQLSEDEQKEYLNQFGLKESGLDRVIKTCYKLLNLITFFTIKGGKQVQAWPIEKDKTAIDAAGEVHSDFAKNFIKAEVVDFDDLIESGSWTRASENGKIRTEGKDYIVKDGDIIEFKIGS